MRVESRFGDSELVEDFVLAAGSQTIELRVILDWREHARLLKLRFPTGLRDAVAAPDAGAVEPPQAASPMPRTLATARLLRILCFIALNSVVPGRLGPAC